MRRLALVFALALLGAACAETQPAPGEGGLPGDGADRPTRPNVGGELPGEGAASGSGNSAPPLASASGPQEEGTGSRVPAASEGGGATSSGPESGSAPEQSAPAPSAGASSGPSTDAPPSAPPSSGVCTPGDRRPCHGLGAAEDFPECNGGTERCDASGNWTGTCEDWTDPATEPCAPASAVCTTGESAPCHGAGPTESFPECNRGTRTCAAGQWGPCVGWTMPADNPCAGLPGCEALTWERALVPTENTVSALWTDAFVSLLEAWGLAVSRAGSIRIDGVEAVDVVVTDASSGITLEDHPGRLRAWMADGGVLVLMGAVLQGTNCRVGNVLLGETGLRFADCDVAARRGPIGRFPGHPITDGLPDRDWPHTEGASVVTFGAGGAEIVVRNTDGFGLVGAQRIGCGGLLVISGKDLNATTNTVQFRTHWHNILDWGSGRR